MMVMEYIGDNISQYLKSNYNELSLKDKLELFHGIVWGLKDIHNKGFIHKDLHSGNILNDSGIYCYITDLGLCKPADDQDGKKNSWSFTLCCTRSFKRQNIHSISGYLFLWNISI